MERGELEVFYGGMHTHTHTQTLYVNFVPSLSSNNFLTFKYCGFWSCTSSVWLFLQQKTTHVEELRQGELTFKWGGVVEEAGVFGHVPSDRWD